MPSRPTDFIPLKPVVFHILLVLVGGERHGYGIVKEVAAQTGGQLNILPGNLYRTIRTITGLGLIEDSGPRPDPNQEDQRRRYFRLTPLGHDVLTAETARMESVAVSARTELEAASRRVGQ